MSSQYVPRIKTFPIICMVMLFFLLLSGCGGVASPTVSSPATEVAPTAATGGATEVSPTSTVATTGALEGGTLNVDVDEPIDKIDPQKSFFASVAMIQLGVVDRLVYPNPSDGKIYPWLAESWEVSPDAKTFTFKLRQDVKFHDGTPFNAEAVKYNFDAMIKKAAYAATALGSYQSTDVLDPFTVRVNFKEPFAPFLTLLGTSYLGMQSPTAMEKYGDQYDQHITGSGPFIFKEYVPDERVTLVKNPDYNWAPTCFSHQGPAYLDGIVYHIVTETPTRVTRLEAGETDFIQNLPPQDAVRLRPDKDYSIIVADSGGMSRHLLINIALPPTDDINVRKALAYATDQEQISNLVFGGIWKPTHAVFTTLTLGYEANPKEAVTYDADMAQKILDDDGWKMGANGIREKDGKPLKVIIAAMAQSLFPETATVVQAQWQAIGIQTDVLVQPVNTWVTTILADKPGTANVITMWQWWPDPSVLENVLGTNVKGLTNIQGPELQAKLAQGDTIADPEARAQWYKDTVNWLLGQYVIIPNVEKAIVDGSKSSVEGVRYEGTGYAFFYDAYFKK